MPKVHGKVKRILLVKPNNFRVEYSINPWMKPGSADAGRALAQWENLVRSIEKEGVKVEIAEFPEDAPPEVVFPRDQSLVLGKRVILANFKYEVRNKEVPYFKKWFEDHGFDVEVAKATFEGGNSIFHSGALYVGTGFRATEEDCKVISEQLGIKVMPLEVTDNKFFHVDLALFSLDQTQAFYFPPAFTPEAQERLKKEIANLYEFTKEEMEGYSANSVSVGDSVIVQKGNKSFASKLESLGKKVIEVDVSEFQKSSGGIHCLTNILE